MEKEKILIVENVSKEYGKKNNIEKVLKDISFEVFEGEFIAIMGSSGSGKTTLLNCISGIDTLTSGTIYIDGININKLKNDELVKFRSQKLGFIFQNLNLLDTLTGYDNIALILSLLGIKNKIIFEKINDISNKLDLDSILKKYPYEMSGGQKQKIACARAVINKPSLILADEPTGSLDSKSSKMLLDNLLYFNKTFKTTILMVTHDVFSASYANRIIFIKDGQILKELKNHSNSHSLFLKQIIDASNSFGGELYGV